MTIRQLSIALAATIFFSCGDTNQETTSYEVSYHGALKNMMHKGDLSAKANLADYATTEHLYALGAIENLKGEVLILDSKPYHTMVKDSILSFDNTYTPKAALLVYASVSKWASIPIPADIVTHEQLEIFVAETAKTNQIDITKPFPFMLSGKVASFDWHVINWKDGDTEHSHEKHINSGLKGTINHREVEMLGFYSDSHHAIFTHHTTNMHIHVKTTDNEIAGHVDGLTLGEDMILKLPAK